MKKEISAFILICCMLFLLLPAGAFASEGILVGSGTESDPYQIFDAADLKVFRDKVNGGEIAACGKLMANIVLNPGTFDETGVYIPAEDEEPRQWTCIGAGQNPYVGTFGGNSYTISTLLKWNSRFSRTVFCY